MIKIKLGTLVMLAASTFLVSCKDDKNSNGMYSNGVFIDNEGAYGNGNASVSFIDNSSKTVYNDIFNTVNKRPLGDVLQSTYIWGENIYMVMNASGKVEVANKESFEQAGVIEGLNQPRSITSSSNKLYISQWGDNGVLKIADPITLKTTGVIKVGNGPEAVLNNKNMVWVANGGGFGLDSTISVIDPSQDKVIKTITVGYNPKEMVADVNGNVWVLCYGYIKYDANWNIVKETESSLVKIDASTYIVSSKLPIAIDKHPSHIDVSNDKQTIYYGGGYGFSGIYAVKILNSSIPASPFIEGSFYGFNVNPSNGDIYACEATTFTEAGNVKQFNSTGVFIKSYKVGIGPNGAIFN